jgi:GT2 family glycosyltransferase
MPPLVSVVIANWNGRRHLQACLPALARQTAPAPELIVVDNGSTDGSQAWLAQNYPAVQLIGNADNRGFAAANNQGIRAARGAFIALLNNDTQPEPGWLAALVSALEQDERLGMAASLMLFADRPAVINSTGVCVDRCGISWDRLGGRPASAAGSAPVPIFGASAGAALYRRELFDDVGLFDEDYFAYLEDVDLAWRARWRGWRAVHVPQARVLHAHSATGHEGSAFKTYWLARNKVRLIAKNYPSPALWWRLPVILFYDGLSLLNAVLRQRNLSALRGRLAGWASLPGVWRQRRVVQRGACVPAAEVFALLEPMDWPWRIQQKRYGHLVARPSPPQ